MRKLAIALSMSSLLGAQTFVVDASGGPGSHFNDLQTAVTTVPDGAVLLVRAGTYTPVTIAAKGLTLVGEPGAKIVDAANAVLAITNTSAQQRVVVRELALENFTTGSIRVECTQCAGPVFLQYVTVPPTAVGNGRRLVVQDCAQLTVDACGPFATNAFAIPWAPVTIADSHATLVGCNVTAPLNRAIVATQSRVDLVTCAISGGSGMTQVLPVIELNGSELWLLGSGAVVGFGAAPLGVAPTITGTGSVRRDPAVLLNNPCQVPNTVAVMPAVVGVDGQIGTAASASMTGPAGALGVLVLGAAGTPLAVLGWSGSFWLDPVVSVPIAVGVLGSALTANVVVPMNPALQGTLFGWQGISFGAAETVISNCHWFAP